MKKIKKLILGILIIILITILCILMAIKVGNKNTIQKQLEETQKLTATSDENSYITTADHLAEVNASVTKLVEFKRAIATAITNQGVPTSEDGTIDIMVKNIEKIGNQNMVRTLIGSSDWKELGQKGWGQPANAAISYTNPIDVTDYNYLVLIYNRYNCYNQKMGFGLYDSSNPTYTQCLNAPLQANESSTGTGSDTHTPRLLYIDISSVEGEKYPFVYLTSQMYGYILHFYLTKSTEIPTL